MVALIMEPTSLRSWWNRQSVWLKRGLAGMCHDNHNAPILKLQSEEWERGIGGAPHYCHILGGILSPFTNGTWKSWCKTPSVESSVLVSTLFMEWGEDVQGCGCASPTAVPIDMSPSCILPRTYSGPPPLLVLGFSMTARASGLLMHGVLLILHLKAVSRTLPLNLQFPSTCLIWFTNTVSPCFQGLRF
jgi:hypothetical protein